MLHIELFHNLYTQTRETFQPARSAPWLEDIVSRSITTPYLVHQLLAFSALHMSTSRPNRQEFYRYYAARLQTQALSTFKETNLAVTHETCVPLFLFATVLGIHMLCDTLIYRENGDFHAFLKRFVDFFRLYRGARTILGEAWFMIEDTPLAPSLNLGKVTFTFDGHLSGGCAKLLDLVISANLGADLTDTYRQAIESLQMCFNVAEGSDERYARINGVTVWPILLKSEFGELLEQGRPEALVILAHYAILLHRFRDSWLFGDSGVYVIVEAGKCLGSEWEEWLRWPNEVLRFS
ncbi:conserved hypothetical protein [Aspergillus terreus NIH2624]|uniref:Uncharacterized protein n=1 Tax=Aspergillus terreus (strain NIH 2624 / FGSC A1156) TaxID=341663 RepID=Q0CSD0_ASPTN|nr:uncharacterized protein ATEG_03404 [Aspergillus terreus NIH2624]EAU36678.1 conserved hypothetical protein [Aspergillus terreus NIH2624]